VTDREILRQIGRNVRAARLKAGMTQECLAELADVHWKTIGRIERGEFPFAVTTLVRLAQHLPLSPNRLLGSLPAADLKRTEKITKALSRKRQPSRRELRVS
jgi:DNA-binding XRE family transcriptional regulator